MMMMMMMMKKKKMIKCTYSNTSVIKNVWETYLIIVNFPSINNLCVFFPFEN